MYLRWHSFIDGSALCYFSLISVKQMTEYPSLHHHHHHHTQLTVPSQRLGSDTIAHGLCAPRYSHGGSLHCLQFTLPAAITVKKLQLDLEAPLYSRTVTNVESNQPVEKIHFGWACTLSLTVKTGDSGLVPHQKLCMKISAAFVALFLQLQRYRPCTEMKLAFPFH